MNNQSRSMMMIASSSSSSKFKGRKKELIWNGMLSKGPPLSGIQQDINHFQKKFPISKIIQTSKDKNTLLNRNYIINTLKNEFRKNFRQFYIFYSGHGHSNGDWAIQTAENPQADCISLEEIIQLWWNIKKYSDSKLFIFSDSCYSGQWCYRLKQISDKRLYLFSSCEWNEISFSYNGGLFFNCILCPLDQFTQNYKLLKQKKQNPIFLSSTNEIIKISEDYLRALNLNITNSFEVYRGIYEMNRFRPYTIDISKKKNQNNEPRSNTSSKNSSNLFQPYPQISFQINPYKNPQYNYSNNTSKPTNKEYVQKQRQQKLKNIRQQRVNRLKMQQVMRDSPLISYQRIKNKQALKRQQVQLPSIPVYPRCKFI